MSRVFVIADTHFGHANVINVPGRKGMFKDIVEHDEFIVDNWNSTVTKRDKVFHLGDIGWDRKGYVTQGILPRLPGIIEVVAGNHDSSTLSAAMARGPGTNKVHGVKVYREAVLTHIPIHPQEMYWDINVHGHLHDNVVRKYATNPFMGKMSSAEKDPRYICVSCEHIGFTPVDLLALLEDHRARWGKALHPILPAGAKRRDERKKK